MWIYKKQPFVEVMGEFSSFVYLIERLNIEEDSESPIFYIGKKTFYNKRKLRGKRILIESDWWDYYGSSDWLLEQVELYGKENFKRTILHLCRTAGDSGYLEAKEHIENNVLHIENNGYKLYYNKNILGRYRNEPEFYLLEEELKTYYNLDKVHGNNYNKVWLNNGKINRLLPKKMAEVEVGNNGWVYGRCEKHIKVNDGTKNLLIPYSEYNKEKHILGYILKLVTNGKKNKKIPLHEVNEFLKNNDEWYLGFNGNNNMMWVTNGVDDKKIKISELNNFNGYKPGRTKIGVKNKISMFKDDRYIWVDTDEIDEKLGEGWEKRGRRKDYSIFNVTNDINQKHFLSEKEALEFINTNEGWRFGQIRREKFNTKDMVFAINMNTDEKVSVTKEEYKNDKNLTSVKSKKIKVKSKNRIIFTGYLQKYLQENTYNIPRSKIMESLKNNGEVIYIKKGKNTILNEFKLSFKYI